ncbi:uncharacterized protein MYCFIDRAFT_180466 [Pseudocercospora fijiensis CIRAD86]|uniref:Uncharacterized protein n=1 Tax=Pseudocercospora fijiensis (strain CIRAD86) TaxID=383855 RepID=M2YGP5_PSEFD|nr:uncharacterized protein MYCFIDRAFT_180466 [Pseudocercospora fijiensis CIRAD86]EME76980.1 hypothetical protein MYCFIDRAFT_180466 [Pseudocercospora fijiensis CIRAD86]
MEATKSQGERALNSSWSEASILWERSAAAGDRFIIPNQGLWCIHTTAVLNSIGCLSDSCCDFNASNLGVSVFEGFYAKHFPISFQALASYSRAFRWSRVMAATRHFVSLAALGPFLLWGVGTINGTVQALISVVSLGDTALLVAFCYLDTSRDTSVLLLNVYAALQPAYFWCDRKRLWVVKILPGCRGELPLSNLTCLRSNYDNAGPLGSPRASLWDFKFSELETATHVLGLYLFEYIFEVIMPTIFRTFKAYMVVTMTGTEKCGTEIAV